MAQFDDHKEDGALRTIGEVAAATGIKPHVLRYWEQQFSQLQPLKRSGGRRYYRAEDVALVERIDDLVNARGYTLKGAKSALRDAVVATSAAPDPAPAAQDSDLAEVVMRLKSIRDDLRAALAD